MRTRLVGFDLDGVIFKTMNFWLDLHRAFGTYALGLDLTKKYLQHDELQRLTIPADNPGRGEPRLQQHFTPSIGLPQHRRQVRRKHRPPCIQSAFALRFECLS